MSVCVCVCVCVCVSVCVCAHTLLTFPSRTPLSPNPDAAFSDPVRIAASMWRHGRAACIRLRLRLDRRPQLSSQLCLLHCVTVCCVLACAVPQGRIPFPPSLKLLVRRSCSRWISPAHDFALRWLLCQVLSGPKFEIQKRGKSRHRSRSVHLTIIPGASCRC